MQKVQSKENVNYIENEMIKWWLKVISPNQQHLSSESSGRQLPQQWCTWVSGEHLDKSKSFDTLVDYYLSQQTYIFSIWYFGSLKKKKTRNASRLCTCVVSKHHNLWGWEGVALFFQPFLVGGVFQIVSTTKNTSTRLGCHRFFLFVQKYLSLGRCTMNTLRSYHA